jgi:ATP-binding protein involved in chromosome partitioning
MSDVTQAQVEEKLATYIDPYLDRDLVSTKSVKEVTVDGDTVSVKVVLGFPAGGYRDELAAKLKTLVEAIDGVATADVEVTSKIAAHSAQKGVKHIEGIKNIIAVASGKGGVGKSTTAVNLALALSAEGATVGILDADIYGPSQPRMLGVHGKPESLDGKSLEPMNSYHLQAMSIGFLVDTGDIQLTLAQQVPVSGAVIVTTPQDIALLDARKGLKMFEKVEVPVLGIVENMSIHICSKCGHEEHIFGTGGGERMAEQYEVDFLGALPLDIQIREDTDGGKPTVVASPDGHIAQAYKQIARRVAAKLSLKAKEYSAKFPNIVIQNN